MPAYRKTGKTLKLPRPHCVRAVAPLLQRLRHVDKGSARQPCGKKTSAHIPPIIQGTAATIAENDRSSNLQLNNPCLCYTTPGKSGYRLQTATVRTPKYENNTTFTSKDNSNFAERTLITRQRMPMTIIAEC